VLAGRGKKNRREDEKRQVKQKQCKATKKRQSRERGDTHLFF